MPSQVDQRPKMTKSASQINSGQHQLRKSQSSKGRRQKTKQQSTFLLKTQSPAIESSGEKLPMARKGDCNSLLGAEPRLCDNVIIQRPLLEARQDTVEWESHRKTTDFATIDSESDVLPAYEGRCPVDPSSPGSKSHLSQCKTSADPLTIQTQMEDDIHGNWFVISQLGEGTWGCVKLIEDLHQRRLLAMKVIAHNTDADTPDAVRKEIAIHRLLRHNNIVQFVGSRVFDRETFIFLEYACGGELYDRIEPDFGVPRAKCQKWFVNLIQGLTYLHGLGICHRDIKPENLLLSGSDELKISDFGLATYFRFKGSCRMLESKCGTAHYIAPEMYVKDQFHGEPLDVWSAGIVLVAMISGELPWEEAHPQHTQFCSWIIGSISVTPWNKLPAECLGLLRRMLDPNPENRATIGYIKSNAWYQRGFTERTQMAPPPKRIRFGGEIPLSMPVPRAETYDCSQNGSQLASVSCIGGDRFSQPVRLEDLLCSQSQSNGASANSLEEQNPFARLVKRLTRFFLSCGVREAVETLTDILTPMHMSIVRTSPGSYIVTGQDRNKGLLTIKISFMKVQKKLLIDFRLSKGNGLEFKRIFPILREKLNHLIDDDEVPWTVRPEFDVESP